jgi:hypothetical protein
LGLYDCTLLTELQNVCDPIGSSNLTYVRKALSSPSASPAVGEARNRVRFAVKITQAQLMVPDWVPDFALHPMGFDVNGAWGPSALHILELTAALSSQATTEPQARIKRRSIQLISRAISKMNTSLDRARQPLPFPSLVQYGP